MSILPGQGLAPELTGWRRVLQGAGAAGRQKVVALVCPRDLHAAHELLYRMAQWL